MNVGHLICEAGGPSSAKLTSVRELWESMKIHILEGKALAAFLKELWVVYPERATSSC